MGIERKNCVFRASAFSWGVVAVPEGVIKVGTYGGVVGWWLLVFALIVSGQIPLLPLAASATTFLKFAALVFLIAFLLTHSASRYASQAPSCGRLRCHLQALLHFSQAGSAS